MEPRMPENKPSRLERLERQKTEIANRIKGEQKKQGRERRKWETNQKVRVGAAIMSEAQRNPEKMAELLKLLDRFFLKDYDRKFFVEWGLSLHENVSTPAATENTSTLPTTPQEP